MDNTNTITFKYRYPEAVTDRHKCNIDLSILSAVTKTFWKMYHDGLITDFYLIDEDMKEGDKKLIKSDKTSTLIEGSNLEVATQFLHIMDAMLENSPEMVAAYISVRNEKIEEAIKSADINDIKMAEFVYKAVAIAERILDDGEA